MYETRNCYPVQSKDVIELIENQLNALIQRKLLIKYFPRRLMKSHVTNNCVSVTTLSKAPNKVCVVYDDRMLNHCDISDDSHPEKPNRISGIFKKYQEYDILDRCYVQQVMPAL